MREEWVRRQSSGMVERLFGGRVVPLVAYFSEQGRLTDQDILERKTLIEELDK